MKQVYGYIRVSTTEQISGASLPEQKSAIKEYAKKNSLNIIHFYEESKTAAKKGRPLFLEMIKNLKAGNANGVIMHKIDRSARNLHDWASVGDLIDNGIDVFFAHESLDMTERGGRLSADIQAVMASDYVRNLRQETIKGLYGRLKQGYYPFCAPIGYLNNGRAEIKTLDITKSNLVKELFKLYCSGKFNIIELSKEMERRGLSNKKGRKVCKSGIVKILKNPFYIGIMKVRDQVFKGNHEPLIETRLFEQVQKILKERNKGKSLKHKYLFRKLLKCHNCNYTMSGELQKGNIYYRCKTKTCNTKCIREDTVEQYVINVLKTISLNNQEVESIYKIIEEEKKHSFKIHLNTLKEYNLKITQIKKKEKKLLDAYLNDILNKDEYKKLKEEVLLELCKIEERKSSIESSNNGVLDKITNLVELCKNPLKIYISAIQEEKREMLEIISSNLTIDRRKTLFTMVYPYHELANRDILSFGDPEQESNRTLNRVIVYSDKNTSPIIPKPMNKKQVRSFYNFLKKIASTLCAPDSKIYCYKELEIVKRE